MLSMTIFACGLQCSSTARKGPYKLDQERVKIDAPSKSSLEIERARVTRDAVIVMLHRSYYKSYCYNGGPLDPNTGCYDGLTNQLPSYTETTEWVQRNKCSVGPDCTDCWGRDADRCLRPEEATKRWVEEKEMVKSSNNNHFTQHTCNLSWRCGIKSADYPTFITRKNDRWTYYTEFANGTELNLDSKDFWTMEDIVLKKTIEPLMETDIITVACFESVGKPLSCYDKDLGNFVEFKKSWVCTGKTCYNKIHKPSKEITSNEIVNLRPSSIEDLHRVIEAEHMLNEELRYNFGLVLKEQADLRDIIIKTVLSSARSDDQLLGSVLGHRSRSKFVTENVFYLLPCEEVTTADTNCYGNLTFQNGRWQNNLNQDQCVNISIVQKINLLQPQEPWFPEIIDAEPIGTAENFDGWSYYAREQDNLQKEMEFTKNLQSTTSLADIANLPKGFVGSVLTGFITLHTITYAVLAVITIYLYRKLSITISNRSHNYESPIQLQSVVTIQNKLPAQRLPESPISNLKGLRIVPQQDSCMTPNTLTNVKETVIQIDKAPHNEFPMDTTTAATELAEITWRQDKANREDHKLGWIN